MPRVRVVSSAAYHEWRALQVRLRKADPELKRNLRKQIRKSGDPALKTVRRATRGIKMTSQPSAGGGDSSGLRRRLSAATRLKVLVSAISFVVVEDRVDPSHGATLTAGSEGTSWRHPVFGNRNVWVRQTGSPWFYPTLRAQTPAFRRAVEQAMRDTIAMLEG